MLSMGSSMFNIQSRVHWTVKIPTGSKVLHRILRKEDVVCLFVPKLVDATMHIM